MCGLVLYGLIFYLYILNAFLIYLSNFIWEKLFADNVNEDRFQKKECSTS